MIIVTADHGEEIFDDGNLQGHGEHLRGEHVLKVPLIVKLPKKTRNQSDSARAANFVTRSIDIAPTILGLAGLQSGGFEGRDLSPWISGSDSIFTDNNAYAETEIWFSRSGNGPYQKQRLDYPGISGLLTFDAGYSGEIILNPKFENIMISSRHRALITTEWKLIYIPGPNGIQWELYNRRIDPNNRVNVLNENSKIADAMQKQLLAQIQKLESNSRLVGGYVVPR